MQNIMELRITTKSEQQIIRYAMKHVLKSVKLGMKHQMAAIQVYKKLTPNEKA